MKRRAKRGEPMEFILNIPDTDECVLWPFGTNKNGYGNMKYKGKVVESSVVSLTIHKGEKEEGQVCCHTPLICHNKLCVNPKHLRWGSYKDNVRDKKIDGTSNRGERNSKLTEEQVLEIRLSPDFHKDIAKRYGISPKTVSNIKTKVRWGWLEGEIVNPRSHNYNKKSLNSEQIDFIINSDLTQVELGDMFGVSGHTISSAISKYKYQNKS